METANQLEERHAVSDMTRVDESTDPLARREGEPEPIEARLADVFQRRTRA